MRAKLDIKSKIFLYILAGLIANALIAPLFHSSPLTPAPEPVKEKPAKPASAGPSPIYAQILAKRDVRARLKDPESAEFTNVTTRGRVVCGFVNSRNGFGGMGGKQRFITRAGAITALEEDMAAGEMEKAWAMLC